MLFILQKEEEEGYENLCDVEDLLADSEDEGECVTRSQLSVSSIPPSRLPTTIPSFHTISSSTSSSMSFSSTSTRKLESSSTSEKAYQSQNGPVKVPKPVQGRRSSKDNAGGKVARKSCPLCEDTFSEKEYSAHARQNHAYKCSFCRLSFTYVNGRDNHQNEAHTLESVVNIQKPTCHICGMDFSRSIAYEKHAKREHKVPCPERGCRFRFTNSTLMEVHAAKYHGSKGGGGGAKTDASTPPVFIKKSSSPVRVRNVYSGASIVDSPTKKGSRISAAIKRSKSAIGELEKTKARLSAVFNLKVKKTTSVAAPDLKKKRGRPSKKGQTVLAASSVASSVPTVSSPSEQRDDTRCEQCGRQIPDFEEFYEHINTDHTEPCVICGMAFLHEFYLREHKYLRHGGPQPSIADRPPSPPPRSCASNATSASPAIDEDDEESDNEDCNDVDRDLGLLGISRLSVEPRPTFRIPKLCGKGASAPTPTQPSGHQFQCDECLESCASAAALVEHVQERHYDPAWPSSSSSNRPPGEPSSSQQGQGRARHRKPDSSSSKGPPPSVASEAIHKKFVCDLCDYEFRFGL